ncbi:MAG: carboxypeptidase regulatory-like domain-containing protein, partial [Mangrovimonas sp.]|nr:carboxypeptidase regulatory-like domain-containing protein [Mangrovimonas sp.]
MKKSLLIFLMGVFSVFTASAQQTIVKGSVKDASSQEPLPGVLVTIEGTNIFVETDANGAFVFTQALPLGEQVLSLTKDGYIPNRYPIVVNEGQIVDITDMILEVNINDAVDLSVITLSDEELDDDVGGADNISGLLQSSQDVFQRTAAFEFSSSFFRIRGLDSENSTMMINGIEMNKTYDGRPQWSDWGGLNDVLRNQELSTGWSPSEYTFGGALGAVNINVRASKYRAGGRITYSSSNRSYTNRLMASYASGLLQNGWAYTLMVSRRWGNEGFQDATFYDA